VSPEEAIRYTLVSDAGIAGLISDRVYAGELPERPIYPSAVYRRISTAPVHSSDGPSGLSQIRLQIDCWSRRFLDARALADRVTAVLDGLHGIAGAIKSDPGVEFSSVMLDADRAEFDDELNLHGCSLDFLLWANTPPSV